jgi:hypothetical protein
LVKDWRVHPCAHEPRTPERGQRLLYKPQVNRRGVVPPLKLRRASAKTVQREKGERKAWEVLKGLNAENGYQFFSVWFAELR